jgi:diguanylate cyclase (GGDEF)-like protein
VPTEDPDAAASSPSWFARTWERARRPEDLIGRTRWLFAVCLGVGLVLVLITAATQIGGTVEPLVFLPGAVLAVSWTRRYVTGRTPLGWDVVECLGLLGLASAFTDPTTALRIAVPCAWFRAVYGSSTPRAVLYTAGGLTAIIGAFPLRASLGLPVTTTTLSVSVGVVPVALLTTVVAHHLTVGLVSREQSQRRDAALARLSADLLAPDLLREGDRGAIRDRAWATVTLVCEATPGLCALGALERPDRLEVTRHAGPIEAAPASLPFAVLPDRPPPLGGAAPAADPTALTDHARGRWLVLPVPGRPDGWLLLGAPREVPPDAVVAVSSLLANVALAVRTSAAHRTLATRAHTDELSGLANRSAFFAALAERLARHDDQPGQSCPVVLFLDLDDFKRVNDGLGHAAGDELLRILGARIRRAVRSVDLCARLGGDEFAVLVDDDSRGEMVAERLVQVVASPVDLGGRHTQVGVSIGLASASPGTTVEQLVQQADTAMYAAKAKGKNRVQVFEAGLLQADAQVALESELRTAVDTGQFVVHYQPVIALDDGRPVAVEALVRWAHPTRGLLLPDAFVATAERTGAIRGMGTHVLRLACADVAALDAVSAEPLAMHVNLSAAQLTDPDFLPGVRACLADHDLAPHRLVFEITESVVLDTPAVRDGLDELTDDIGVTLAIDDFGTGYSALTTLRTLPLDLVKIDRSFVAGCPTNTADRTVVEAVVHMARQLGLSTVAEGVERPEQQEVLRAVGVGAAQGFLHLRPAPLDELIRWLRSRSRPATPELAGSVTPLRGARTGAAAG